MKVSSGLMSEFTKPRKRPTNAKLSQGSAPPKGSMPGTMNVAMAIAMEVRSQLRMKRMISPCMPDGAMMGRGANMVHRVPCRGDTHSSIAFFPRLAL